MAELKAKLTLDDSELKQKIKGIKRELDSAMNDAVSKAPSKTGLGSKNSIKSFIDERANKTITESINALGRLEDKAQQTATQIASLRSLSRDLTSAKAALNKEYYSGQVSADAYGTAMAGIEAQQRAVATSLQVLNRDIKQSIQLENAATGSLEEARIKLAQMTAEITKMGGAMDGTNPEFTTMIARHKELREEVTAMEQKLGQYQRNVGNYASGWNGMQHSINQMTRELPAFTYSVQTGFMALSNNIPIFVDELNKAAAANKALTAEGKKGVPVWKQLIGGIFHWQTGLSIGITLMTVYSKEIWEWTKALFEGKSALDELKKATEELNEARSEGTKAAQAEITSLNTLYRAATNSTLSYGERFKAVKKLQEQYPNYFKNIDAETVMAGKATTAYEKLSKSIIATAQARAYENKITEISTKMLENNEAILEKRRSVTEKDRAKMQFEDDLIRNGGMITSASTWGSGTSAPRKALAEAAEMEEANDKLSTQIERYRTEIDKLIMTNGVDIIDGPGGGGGAGPKITNNELDKYKSLIDKLADIDREYSRQFMSSNEAEVQAVRDKFAEIRKEIEEYNSKKPKIRIDVSTIETLEQRAVEEVEYRQNTSVIATDLEKQKELYDEYNAYVKDAGVKAADEQYRFQLNAIREFRSNLEQEYLKTVALEESVTVDGFNGTTNKLTRAQEERAAKLKEIREEVQRQEQEEIRQNYAEASNMAMDFNERRLEIEQQYAKRRMALGAKITDSQREELDRQEAREISEIAADELMGSDSWSKLFDNLDELTAKQLDKLIGEIESRFDELSVNFDPIDLAAVRKKLREAKDLVIKDNPFAQVGRALRGIFDEAANETKDGAQNIKRNWTDLAKATQSSFDFVQDAISSADFLKEAIGDVGQTALTSMMAVASSAIAVTAAIKTAEKASIVLAVIQSALIVVNAIANVFKSIFNSGDRRLEKSIESKRQAVEDLDRAFQQLQRSMERVAGESYYKIGEAQIRNLQEQRAITEQMVRDEEAKKKADRDKVNEYKDQLQNIDNQIEDINQSMNEALTQTNFKEFSDQITATLRSIYEAGDGFKDLDKTFDDFVKNALFNSLRLRHIEPVIKDMLDGLANYMKTNDNSLMGFDFEKWRDRIGEAGDVVLGALDSAYEGLGLDKFGGDATSNLASEGIQRISEETGTELVGMFRSTYDINKQQLAQLGGISAVGSTLVAAANDQLSELNAINANTAETVKRLDVAIEHLSSMDNSLGRRYI